jgi:hypothetical protein
MGLGFATSYIAVVTRHGRPRTSEDYPATPAVWQPAGVCIWRPSLILTGTVVARKALREVPHRFAASGLDPLRHPGVLAAMSSMPQPATHIPLSAISRSTAPLATNPRSPAQQHTAPPPRTKAIPAAQPRAPQIRPLPKSVMHVASSPHDPRLQNSRSLFPIFVLCEILQRLSFMAPHPACDTM